MEFRLTKGRGRVTSTRDYVSEVSALDDGEYVVSIREYRAPRSDNQNRLMWMWLSCMEQATGSDKECWHSHYRHKFLTRHDVVDGRTLEYAASTTTLNRQEMAEYLSKIQADAAAEWGITLPSPQDPEFEGFMLEFDHLPRRR